MVDKIVPTDRLATLEDPDGNRDNGSFDSCLHSATREGTGADCRLKILNRKLQIVNLQSSLQRPDSLNGDRSILLHHPVSVRHAGAPNVTTPELPGASPCR